MKKFLKIIGLYILFGAILAIIVSVTGAFEGFMAVPSLGMNSFFALVLVIVAIWLPSLAIVLFSNVAYFPFAYAKVIIAVIIVAFVLMCVYILRKK